MRTSLLHLDSIAFAFGTMASGRGKSGGEPSVTIETGLKVHSDVPSPAGLLKLGIRSGVQTCLQPEILVGFKLKNADFPEGTSSPGFSISAGVPQLSAPNNPTVIRVNAYENL